ncbi:MAG TPA: hypothetical protein VES73_07570 [Lamprocystis sp. (in: g-proteobacteria)]|nr:hypothetical protein [Lamprocystis sp. (in: g-proteobacteria)]
MNKIVQAASVLALTVAASSAGAWYGAPDQTGCPTDAQRQAMAEQQQAFATQQRAFYDQQQAMATQYAKDAEQAMAVQRQAAEQAMTAQRQAAEQEAARFAELQKNAPQGGAYAPNWDQPAAPVMPPMPRFERPQMPDFAMRDTPDFKAPEFPAIPAMPDMPAFGRPASPDFATNGFKELDAYRAKAHQEMTARRPARKEQSDRRRAERVTRGFGPRPVGFGPAMEPGQDCTQVVAPTAQPQAAVPVAAQPTTVAVAPVK